MEARVVSVSPGKNERSCQTLFRSLDNQLLAASHKDLQARVDELYRIYNTERPTRGCRAS